MLTRVARILQDRAEKTVAAFHRSLPSQRVLAAHGGDGGLFGAQSTLARSQRCPQTDLVQIMHRLLGRIAALARCGLLLQTE